MTGFHVLACGPYFQPAGMITSLAIFLFIKPYAYFAYIQAYRFRAGAKRVPWDRGALFIPSLRWTKSTGKQLVGGLIAWHLWAERHNKAALQKQIHNNIRSLSLARVVGYRSPGWKMISLDRWLVIWGKVVALVPGDRLDRFAGSDAAEKGHFGCTVS